MSVKFWLFPCLLVLLSCHVGGNDVALLFRSLHALTRGLEFMNERVEELNLDAILCIRQVEAQLDSFLAFHPAVFLNFRRWLEVLRDKAKRVGDAGRKIVLKEDPDYAAYTGYAMREHKKRIWYPSCNISEDLVEDSVDCSVEWNRTKAMLCLREIGYQGSSEKNPCDISTDCVKVKTVSKQRDYVLTHQVLHWILAEEYECLDGIPEAARLRLCSNVMRDARRIAANSYPTTHYDLLMEQIGLCGFWGFRDFNNREWLERILELQRPSGCYADYNHYTCIEETSKVQVRKKRSERILSDGCLTHKTSVALMALVVNMRFEAERLYSKMGTSRNRVNSFLE